MPSVGGAVLAVQLQTYPVIILYIICYCRDRQSLANIRSALFAVMLTDFLCSIFAKQKTCGFLSAKFELC